MKTRYLRFAMGLLMLSCSTGHGAVVELQCEDVRYDPLSTDVWSFDFDTQILTLTELRSEVPSDPFYWDYLNSIRMNGYLDGFRVDTFTITRNIANESPVAWTGLVMNFEGDISTNARIVDGSAHSSVFSEVTSHTPRGSILEFSGGGVVLPGETLAIQFDVFVDARHSNGVFRIAMDGNPVPEPASILILGCGAMMLRSRRLRRTTRTSRV